MAVTRAKRAQVEAGVWRQWGDYWRSKGAEQNLDTRQWTVEDSLQVAPFTAAVLVLAKTLAASEWIVERMTSNGEWERVMKNLPAWLDVGKRPNQWQSAQDFRKMLSLNLTLFGNAVAVATDRTWNSEWPNQMTAWPWTDVSVVVDGEALTLEDRMKDRRENLNLGVPGYGSIPRQLSYVLSGNDGYKPLTAFQTKGSVVHIRYATVHDVIFGHSPLRWAAPAVRTAVAADALSELGFLYGMMGPGILAHKGKPGDGLIESTRKYLAEVMRNPEKRHSPLLVSGEWSYQRTQASQQELQLMEQRKLAWSLASAVFGVPKELLGGPDNSLSGTGVRHLQRYFAIFHAHDHLVSVATALSEALPRGWRLRIVPNHLLELEPAEQSRVLDRLVRLGVLSPSEARAELGLPPREDVDDNWEKVLGGAADQGGESDSGKDEDTPDEKTTNLDE